MGNARRPCYPAQRGYWDAGSDVTVSALDGELRGDVEDLRMGALAEPGRGRDARAAWSDPAIPDHRPREWSRTGRPRPIRVMVDGGWALVTMAQVCRNVCRVRPDAVASGLALV